MQSKLAKISLLFLALSIIFRLLSIFIDAAKSGSPATTILNGILTGLIVAFAAILLVVILNDRWLGRYKRAMLDMSRTAETYISVPAYGGVYRLLSADENGLTFWKIRKATPVAIKNLPWNSIVIEKARVNITAIRTSDGINLRSTEGKPSLSLVLYDEKTNLLGGKTISGQKLNEIIGRWQEKRVTV